MNRDYSDGPSRADVDAIVGAVLLEFGTPWCGHCRAAQPLLEEAMAGFADITHIKVEDGSGRKLGRSFSVTLWPTLVFLRDGQEISRLVRPTQGAAITQALAHIHTKAT